MKPWRRAGRGCRPVTVSSGFSSTNFGGFPLRARVPDYFPGSIPWIWLVPTGTCWRKDLAVGREAGSSIPSCNGHPAGAATAATTCAARTPGEMMRGLDGQQTLTTARPKASHCHLDPCSGRARRTPWCSAALLPHPQLHVRFAQRGRRFVDLVLGSACSRLDAPHDPPTIRPAFPASRNCCFHFLACLLPPGHASHLDG